MKTTCAITTFPLMVTSLLVAITSSGIVVGENESVYDSRGEPVKANARYFIEVQNLQERASISHYGSKKLEPYSCPQRVVSMSYKIVHPLQPVVFVLSSDVVRVSTELNIKFVMSGHCGESGFWRVPESSLSVKEVVLSGSKSSNDSTFTIKKSDGFYKFGFGSGDKPMNIGVDVIGPGVRRLILSNDSDLLVSFVPALL